MNIRSVGDGKVVLISGGGRIYTDIAARFCRSEKDLESIIASDYDRKIVENILGMGHLAATEFDYFIFGIEGYSRITEAQLIRKRLASYLIKSGRCDKSGKRSFDVVIPNSVQEHYSEINIPTRQLFYENSKTGEMGCLTSLLKGIPDQVQVTLNIYDILNAIESWYDDGIKAGIKEEDLRYLKPQATEFKGIIGMNAHALLDWFKIRCCMNAQSEIRDLANKMLKLCKESTPDLFKDAGPSCKVLGYCPENQYQNPACSGIIKKDDAISLIREYWNGVN